MFHQRLNAIRRARGIPAWKIAKYLNLSERTYRYYESGHREPTLTVLVKIADYLDISLDELLCRDDYIAKKERDPS